MTCYKQLKGYGVVDDLPDDGVTQLCLPADLTGTQYHNAQIDDYAGLQRQGFSHRVGRRLELKARFSHGADELVGTAGFGFWNAPYGSGVALPQAVWFFFASNACDLPLNPDGAGRGWFASTIDAGSWRAKRLIPLAPLALVGNQFGRIHQRIMPPIMNQLGISYAPIAHDMTEWQHYRLDWQQTGCRFYINGELLMKTDHAPRGPLGFVCWIDNQYAVVTARGRVASGVQPVTQMQSLYIRDLEISEPRKCESATK